MRPAHDQACAIADCYPGAMLSHAAPRSAALCWRPAVWRAGGHGTRTSLVLQAPTRHPAPMHQPSCRHSANAAAAHANTARSAANQHSSTWRRCPSPPPCPLQHSSQHSTTCRAARCAPWSTCSSPPPCPAAGSAQAPAGCPGTNPWPPLPHQKPALGR